MYMRRVPSSGLGEPGKKHGGCDFGSHKARIKTEWIFSKSDRGWCGLPGQDVR